MLCLMRAVSNTAEMLSSWRVTEEEDEGIKKGCSTAHTAADELNMILSPFFIFFFSSSPRQGSFVPHGGG